MVEGMLELCRGGHELCRRAVYPNEEACISRVRCAAKASVSLDNYIGMARLFLCAVAEKAPAT